MRVVLDEDSRAAPPARVRPGWVLPGEPIEAPPGALRGHGTCEAGGEVRATVVGRVERVSRLVGVRAWRGRYTGDVGAVVIGTVQELAARRWRLDVGAPQLASLALAAINLPGGVLRRRTDLDALQMREHFCEGDVVACEVQAVHHDGALALHTRSLRYGKLRGGTIVRLDPSLVARAPSAFAEVEELAVIVGANGVVWCGPALPPLPEREELAAEEPGRLAREEAARLALAGGSVGLRRKIAAVAAVARLSARLLRPVSAPRLARLLQRMTALDVAPHQLDAAFLDIAQ